MEVHPAWMLNRTHGWSREWHPGHEMVFFSTQWPSLPGTQSFSCFPFQLSHYNSRKQTVWNISLAFCRLPISALHSCPWSISIDCTYCIKPSMVAMFLTLPDASHVYESGYIPWFPFFLPWLSGSSEPNLIFITVTKVALWLAYLLSPPFCGFFYSCTLLLYFQKF